MLFFVTLFANVIASTDVMLPLIDEWAITFGERNNISEFAKQYNLKHIGTVGKRNTYLFHLDHSKESKNYSEKHQEFFSLLDSMNENVFMSHENSPHQIIWWERQKLYKVTKRYLLYGSDQKRRVSGTLPFKDPLLPTQWHLHNLTEPTNHVHINVLPAWKRGIYGRNVTIAIIDDGVQYKHPDLYPNWRSVGNWNYKQTSLDVQPQSKDWHGTAVAGLAVAYPDGEVCGVGVAPYAQFTAVVLLQEDLTHTDWMAAIALEHEYDINDIYSNSWGPEDDGLRKERPGTQTEIAIKQAIEKGRKGLGSLYVWAAGNGKQNKDNCNYDGYANSRFVATFGTVDSLGFATEYSEPCSALIGVLPSGSVQDTMQTTDLMGSSGQNTMEGPLGNCNVNFAGTSAAAPIAAGIAALMLEANPLITWLDFQYILKLSAIRNDPSHWSWRLNGAGYWVSHFYGFGIIDANKSVALAQLWKTKQSIQEVSESYSIPENRHFEPIVNHDKYQGSTMVQSSVMVNASLMLHHVEVIVDIKHNFRGHLDIRLTSPFGTESIFAEEHNDYHSDYSNWKFSSLLLWGEGSSGKWKLTIIDKSTTSPDSDAMLIQWVLNLYGIKNSTSYEDIFWPDEGSSVWDFRGVDVTIKPFTDSSFYLLNTTDSLWKIALMVTLICGTFIMVVTFIVVYIVRRDKVSYKLGLLAKNEVDEIQLDSEYSDDSL